MMAPSKGGGSEHTYQIGTLGVKGMRQQCHGQGVHLIVMIDAGSSREFEPRQKMRGKQTLVTADRTNHLAREQKNTN